MNDGADLRGLLYGPFASAFLSDRRVADPGAAPFAVSSEYGGSTFSTRFREALFENYTEVAQGKAYRTWVCNRVLDAFRG